jgi:hypothetical protein
MRRGDRAQGEPSPIAVHTGNGVAALEEIAILEQGRLLPCGVHLGAR